MCCFALVVGSGLLTTILCNVILVIFISCLFAASTVIPRGTPTIYDHTSLSTRFSSVCGICTCTFFPPRGAFVITPSIACHFQSIPVLLSYTDKLEPGIKTRSNSKVKSTNCHARNMSVIRQQTNLKRWERSVSYGYRWIAETVFSSIKRTFGEYVAARKFPHMVREIFLKAALYNMFNRMT